MKITTKIIKAYTIALLIVGIIFFSIIPKILNYPPDSINNEFQKNVEIGMTYTEQYCGIMFICYLIGLITIKVKTRKIEKIDVKNFTQFDKEHSKIMNSIFNLPYTIYLMHLIIPTFMITSIYALSEGSINFGTIKIALAFVTIETLTSLILFIYCKNLISNILRNYNINKEYITNVTSLKNKIFVIIIPMILVALIFTTILGFSQIVEQKGEYMYLFNKKVLDEYITDTSYSMEEFIDIINQIKLYNKNDDIFIIYSENEYITLRNNELSEFFVKYTIQQAEQHGNRTYDTYGIDKQGVEKKIILDGREAYVGILFDIAPLGSLVSLGTSILSLFIINCVVLYYVSRSIANDIKEVANALNLIAKDKSKVNKTELPITSNDEISQLVISFNEIQDLTNEYIRNIEEKQDLLVRQENLTILGEMAGGMAHDINNPASAINMSINVLYNIDDKEEKKKILDNMSECVKRILTIVSSVRDQFRNIGETKKEIFNINDVLKNIEIVMHNQLNKYNCTLNIDNEKDFKVFGEKNKLNQVLSNIIINSIFAYKDIEKNGEICVDIIEEEQYNVIKIRDFAGGIPEKIRDKLFTKILTTRGTQGTGLGLYLAKSIIEDEFNGKIYFDTETDKGTTFFIKLKKVED